MAAQYTAWGFRQAWNYFRPQENVWQPVPTPVDPSYANAISGSPSTSTSPTPSLPADRTTTIVGRLRTATVPPRVRLFRLPSHRLLTLEPSADNSVVLRVYAGNPRDWSETTEVMLEKVNRTRSSGYFDWVEQPLRDFMRQHCQSCPHMMRHTMDIEGAQFCSAGVGAIHQAFDVERPDGEPTCLAGHERPVYAQGADTGPAISFIPRLPVNYGITLNPNGEYNRDSLNVRYLLEHDGAFFRGRALRAFNTWSTGGICWGQQIPELAETTDRIYRTIFNLDLMDDYQGIIGSYRYGDQQYRDALGILEDPTIGDPLPYLETLNFTAIPGSTVLSLNNEVNGLLLVDKPFLASAFYALAASGAAVEGDRIMLPLKAHVIQAGNSFVSGYITPIMPRIGRCWFLQATNSFAGELLGQIDPPEFPE